jgi:hypothetical protein
MVTSGSRSEQGIDLIDEDLEDILLHQLEGRVKTFSMLEGLRWWAATWLPGRTIQLPAYWIPLTIYSSYKADLSAF